MPSTGIQIYGLAIFWLAASQLSRQTKIMSAYSRELLPGPVRLTIRGAGLGQSCLAESGTEGQFLSPPSVRRQAVGHSTHCRRVGTASALCRLRWSRPPRRRQRRQSRQIAGRRRHRRDGAGKTRDGRTRHRGARRIGGALRGIHLKGIVYLRKHFVINFAITVFHCAIKNKHLPSLFCFILL